MIAKPQLGFGEAVKLAWSRLTEINGRSRRSEFWWTMLAYVLCGIFVGSIAGLVLPPVAAQIVGALFQLLVLPLTIRRVQDTGHSKWWPILSWLAGAVINIMMAGAQDALSTVNPDSEAAESLFTNPVFWVSIIVALVAGLATFIFCLLDSKPEANKYGESPKYTTQTDNIF
ncbi:MAG: DUF805 domain-containing protein [Prevotella sp.]|nr:DUF805 domain-containing protein [Prevotella sp.]